jgi:hypothetical protein
MTANGGWRLWTLVSLLKPHKSDKTPGQWYETVPFYASLMRLYY